MYFRYVSQFFFFVVAERVLTFSSAACNSCGVYPVLIPQPHGVAMARFSASCHSLARTSLVGKRGVCCTTLHINSCSWAASLSSPGAWLEAVEINELLSANV